MISSVAFKNFRCFRNVEIEGIKPITLLSGENGAGKTTVLEGVFLLCDHQSQDAFLKLNNFRGIGITLLPQNMWEPAFSDMNMTKELYLSMMFAGVKHDLCFKKDENYAIPTMEGKMPPEWGSLSMGSSLDARFLYALEFLFNKNDYSERGHFFVISYPPSLRRDMHCIPEGTIYKMPFAQYIGPRTVNNSNQISEWYGRIELAGKKRAIINALKILNTEINDLTIIVENGVGQLYANVGSPRMISLGLMGDGMNKLLNIILSIVSHPDSVLLIDEIENGFHYSMHEKLWNTIASIAEEHNVQVIATTHSYECISGAVNGINKAGRGNDFSYIRLGKNKGDIVPNVYSNELLGYAITSEMEVR